MSVGSAAGGADAPGPSSTPSREPSRLSGSPGVRDGPSGAGAGDGPAEGEAGLREAARQLEGVFIQKLFQAMRSTVPDGGYLDSARGEKMFRGLMDRHLAQEAAKRMDRGLGEALYRQLRGAVDGAEDAASPLEAAGEPPGDAAGPDDDSIPEGEQP